MGARSGFMLKIEGGGKAIAYHKEQRPEFIASDKMLIHYLDDNFLPIIENNKPKTGLEDRAKLTLIGYTD